MVQNPKFDNHDLGILGRPKDSWKGGRQPSGLDPLSLFCLFK